MKSRLFDVQKNGTNIGPFEFATIVRMMEAGMLQEEDLFREAGEEAWRPLFMLGEAVENLPQEESPEIEAEMVTRPPERRSKAPLFWTLGAIVVVASITVFALTYAGFFHSRTAAPQTASSPVSVEPGPAETVSAAGAEPNPSPASDEKVVSEKHEVPAIADHAKAPANESANEPAKPAAPVPALQPINPRADLGQAYRAKAEQGDALHQALLADALLIQGWTGGQFKEGADWAEKSAKQNHALGRAILAHAVENGLGRTLDRDVGREMAHENAVAVISGAADGPPVWYRWAALAPQRWFANFPEAHESVEQRVLRRDAMLRRAAEGGDFQASVELARQIYNRSGQPAEEQAETLLWLRKAADARYPAAMHELARLTLEDEGSENNAEQAFSLYQQAADLGWGWSQLELAMLQHAGSNVSGPDGKISPAVHVERWRANPVFATEMFRRLALGDGLAKSEEEAAKWLDKLSSAEQAIAIARHIHALLAVREREPQFAEAEKWFTKLENLNDIPQFASTELAHVARTLGLGDSSATPPRLKAPEESNKWLLRAAALGSLDAMQDLGSRYSDGYLVQKDKAIARMWYSKAAASDDASSLWYYAGFLEKEGELAEAARLYRRALAGGQFFAAHGLAEILAAGGPGIPKDDAEATILYRKVATRGELRSYRAAAILCWRLRKGLGTPLSPDEVSQWERKMEQTVKSKDQQQRAWMFDEISLVFSKAPYTDKDEAFRWLSRAADAGSSSALHLISIGGGKSTAESTKAVEALKKLAERGDVYSMYALGRRYSKGEGVKKDEKEATKWILQAAEAGEYFAFTDLGFRCKQGVGTPKDAAAAVKWFRKAAEAKDASAMFLLGVLYESGDGVKKDGAEAARWYEKSAIARDVGAMVNLAIMYARGTAIPKDFVRAYAWTNVAAASDPEPAAKKAAMDIRQFLEESATREQVAEGQKLTRAIIAEMERYTTSFYTKPKDTKPRRPMVATGTAWAITADGHLVTCAHVVEGASTLKVTSTSGVTIPATVVKIDAKNDLALLKITSPTPALPLEFSAETGEKVATLGFPNADIQGLEPKLTEGIVSSVSGLQDDRKVLQITVPVQPGNSGGPLVNMDGAVVGVISSKLSDIEGLRLSGSLPQAVNFAVKAQQMESLMSGVPGWRKARADESPSPLGLPELARKVRASIYFVEVTIE